MHPSSSIPVDRSHLLSELEGLLQPQLFRDYGPNGLQVEGRREIRTLVSGVTASLALIDEAIEAGADAILVHHGLFWRGQEGRVTGWMRKRLARLLAHDVNLLAYHLPLDAHPHLGNNAQLALKLSIRVPDAPAGRFGDQGLGFLGERDPGTLAQLADDVQRGLGRTATVIGEPGQEVRQVALCTGGAQGYFEAAIAAGADVFITGEISEPQAHYARESGVAYIACGHHASERYGVAALGGHVAGLLGLKHHFIDIDNPA